MIRDPHKPAPEPGPDGEFDADFAGLFSDEPAHSVDEPFDEAGERKKIKAHSPRRQRRRAERMIRGARGGIAVNMTPMIDVVFQILIYFLLTTHFVAGEEIFRVDLPEATSSEPSGVGAGAGFAGDPFDLDKDPIRVLVTTTGSGRDDCQLEIVGPLPDPVSFEELRRVLRDRLVDPATGVGMFARDHPILLEPSPGTTWEHSVEAFNAAVRAGYSDVIFQSLP